MSKVVSGRPGSKTVRVNAMNAFTRMMDREKEVDVRLSGVSQPKKTTLYNTEDEAAKVERVCQAR